MEGGGGGGGGGGGSGGDARKPRLSEDPSFSPGQALELAPLSLCFLLLFYFEGSTTVVLHGAGFSRLLNALTNLSISSRIVFHARTHTH